MARGTPPEGTPWPGPLVAHFQQIFDVAGGVCRPHYLEALARRAAGEDMLPPAALFAQALRKGRTAAIDAACVRAALGEARVLPGHVRVGLNVHASTLAREPEFLNLLGDAASANGIHPTRLVIEIVQHAPAWHAPSFRNALDGLRAIGARIALDDVGLGPWSYRMILECRPHYLKVDGHFVHGARADYYSQAVLASIARLAGPFGARVVAEGVENADDLHAVMDAGITLVQGWLFGAARAAREFDPGAGQE